MVDLDYLRKVYSGYTTDELIESLLVRSVDFVPEALSVVREEFQKREGDINNLIEKEISKSGLNESVITEVLYLAPEKDVVSGNLHLTSKGIFFVPISYKSEIIPLGFFIYALGIVGITFEKLFQKLSEKYPEKLYGSELSTMIENKKLPLSLLTKYVKCSYGEYVENIKSITYLESGDFSIRSIHGKTGIFSLDKTNIHLLKTWISSRKVPCKMGRKSKGFLKWMFEKLFKKSRK